MHYILKSCRLIVSGCALSMCEYAEHTDEVFAQHKPGQQVLPAVPNANPNHSIQTQTHSHTRTHAHTYLLRPKNVEWPNRMPSTTRTSVTLVGNGETLLVGECVGDDGSSVTGGNHETNSIAIPTRRYRREHCTNNFIPIGLKKGDSRSRF